MEETVVEKIVYEKVKIENPIDEGLTEIDSDNKKPEIGQKNTKSVQTEEQLTKKYWEAEKPIKNKEKVIDHDWNAEYQKCSRLFQSLNKKCSK